MHSGNGKRKSRLSLEAHARDTSESCSLFDRASLSFHASHSRACTRTPLDPFFSHPVRPAFLGLESFYLSHSRGEKGTETVRSWPTLIETANNRGWKGRERERERNEKITRIRTGSRSAHESERDTRRFSNRARAFRGNFFLSPRMVKFLLFFHQSLKLELVFQFSTMISNDFCFN